MGEVRVTATVRNFVDVALAEPGSGRIEDVPSSRLDCLVATGVLCAPCERAQKGSDNHHGGAEFDWRERARAKSPGSDEWSILVAQGW